MEKSIRLALEKALGGPGEIYGVKKYAIRRGDEEKQTFGPCFLACAGDRVVLAETEDGRITRMGDVSAKVDPSSQKKFKMGRYSYKIGKKIEER